jgi:hypothetical protein
MSRNFVAFGLLALAGMLAIPEPAVAAGGIRAGGGPQVTLRPPVMLRAQHPRAGLINPGRAAARAIGRPAMAAGTALQLPSSPKLRLDPRHPHLGHHGHNRHHHHHRRFVTGWIYPITVIGDEWSYVGVPYGPAEPYPVYAPSNGDAAEQPTARVITPAAPRVTAVPSEGQDACRAERVTVPAQEGDREITVIRC